MSIISKLPAEFCGNYYSKRKYPNKHLTDQLTQDILTNKRRLCGLYAADRITSKMDWYVEKYELDFVTHIIPVPNYGSNNNCKAPLLAAILAQKIHKRTGKNIYSHYDVLKRLSKTRQQRAGQVERRLSAETDFKISDHIKHNNNLIRNNKLLLIDDIITTGATTSVCQDLLYDNGAGTVNILCAARTLQ